MSSLLKEAIVDAKALRSAALQNAETTIVEKYSDEVRQTLERLLEQEDELDLGMPGEGGEDFGAPMGDMGGMEEEIDPTADEIVDDVPLAATDGFSNLDATGLSDVPEAGENVEVTVNLDAIQEALRSLQEESEAKEIYEFSENDLKTILQEEDPVAIPATVTIEDDEDVLEEDALEDGYVDAPQAGGGEAMMQSADTKAMDSMIGEDREAFIDSIVEKLTVDMGAELSGWAGRSHNDMHWEYEKEYARRRSTDIKTNLDTLRKAHDELVFENKQLIEQNKQYKQATNELKESLQDVNLSNARLLYTNRVLRNTSLNERQKETIVEAISRARSVTEARTILDTLQATVQATPKVRPQSLGEAINRRNGASVIRASRQEKQVSDPLQERMKRLAGIK